MEITCFCRFAAAFCNSQPDDITSQHDCVTSFGFVLLVEHVDRTQFKVLCVTALSFRHVLVDQARHKQKTAIDLVMHVQLPSPNGNFY